MSNTMNGYCGSVTSSGQITSNGNLSCQHDTGSGIYTLSYGDDVTNPVPVASNTTVAPDITFCLNVYSSGFKLYAFNNEGIPVDISFDFIVAEMV